MRLQNNPAPPVPVGFSGFNCLLTRLTVAIYFWNGTLTLQPSVCMRVSDLWPWGTEYQSVSHEAFIFYLFFSLRTNLRPILPKKKNNGILMLQNFCAQMATINNGCLKKKKKKVSHAHMSLFDRKELGNSRIEVRMEWSPDAWRDHMTQAVTSSIIVHLFTLRYKAIIRTTAYTRHQNGRSRARVSKVAKLSHWLVINTQLCLSSREFPAELFFYRHAFRISCSVIGNSERGKQTTNGYFELMVKEEDAAYDTKYITLSTCIKRNSYRPWGQPYSLHRGLDTLAGLQEAVEPIDWGGSEAPPPEPQTGVHFSAWI